MISQVGARADIFSAVLANDFVVVQQLIALDPNSLKSRINQQTFPPGPENVHNILTFSIGMGCGPLHAAVKGNHAAMVEYLVSAGLSPDDRGGYDDQTPLHSAAWNDHLAATESLLRCGADINVRSGKIHNNSPAGWAIVAGSASVFECLIHNGAEIFDWFWEDAEAAIRGQFRQFKNVPQQNYVRIQTTLKAKRNP